MADMELSEYSAGTPTPNEEIASKIKGGSFREQMEEYKKINPEAFGEGVEDSGEAPPVAAKENAATEEVTDEPEKEIKKPWARMRRLENERDAKDAQIGDLRHRIDTMANLLQRQIDADSAPEPEPEIDRDADPVGALFKRFEAIEKRLDEQSKGQQIERVASQIENQLRSVDAVLASEFDSERSGDERSQMFAGAIEHLAGVMGNAAEAKFPEATHEQRFAWVADAFNRTKLDWLRTGKDPVREMYHMAEVFGWNADAQEAKVAARLSGKAGASKEDPRKVAVARRERERAATTIGGTEGSANKRHDASGLARAKNATEFGAELDKLYAAGVLRKDNTRPGKTPSMAELLRAVGK